MVLTWHCCLLMKIIRCRSLLWSCLFTQRLYVSFKPVHADARRRRRSLCCRRRRHLRPLNFGLATAEAWLDRHGVYNSLPVEAAIRLLDMLRRLQRDGSVKSWMRYFCLYQLLKLEFSVKLTTINKQQKITTDNTVFGQIYNTVQLLQ